MSLYPLIKLIHVALVTTSVGFFALRGAGVLLGARWPLAATSRRVSMVIDTFLLASGGTLWWLLALHPLRQTWLGVKLALLVIYIVLGVLALGRARSGATRVLAFVAALAVAGAMMMIAGAHDPMAPVRWITR
jgi:uncharacterized membrane protein SirB2